MITMITALIYMILLNDCNYGGCVLIRRGYSLPENISRTNAYLFAVTQDNRLLLLEV